MDQDMIIIIMHARFMDVSYRFLPLFILGFASCFFFFTSSLLY